MRTKRELEEVGGWGSSTVWSLDFTQRPTGRNESEKTRRCGGILISRSWESTGDVAADFGTLASVPTFFSGLLRFYSRYPHSFLLLPRTPDFEFCDCFAQLHFCAMDRSTSLDIEALKVGGSQRALVPEIMAHGWRDGRVVWRLHVRRGCKNEGLSLYPKRQRKREGSCVERYFFFFFWIPNEQMGRSSLFTNTEERNASSVSFSPSLTNLHSFHAGQGI